MNYRGQTEQFLLFFGESVTRAHRTALPLDYPIRCLYRSVYDSNATASFLAKSYHFKRSFLNRILIMPSMPGHP